MRDERTGACRGTSHSLGLGFRSGERRRSGSRGQIGSNDGYSGTPNGLMNLLHRVCQRLLGQAVLIGPGELLGPNRLLSQHLAVTLLILVEPHSITCALDTLTHPRRNTCRPPNPPPPPTSTTNTGRTSSHATSRCASTGPPDVSAELSPPSVASRTTPSSSQSSARTARDACWSSMAAAPFTPP